MYAAADDRAQHTGVADRRLCEPSIAGQEEGDELVMMPKTKERPSPPRSC